LVGFDEDYRRGYYEDTDMCLRIKEREYGLVLHRGSVVIHHHGISMGRNQKATERAQAKNQRIFLERWSAKLPLLVELATGHELAGEIAQPVSPAGGHTSPDVAIVPTDEALRPAHVAAR
jgi:GT2 family glycosyltransferase